MTDTAVVVELEDLGSQFQNLDATAQARRDRFIARAKNGLNADVLGDQYNYAVALKAAHMLTKNDSNQVSDTAEVVEVKVDNAQTKFADPTSSSNTNRGDWAATKWGRELKDLLDSCFAEPWILNE